MSQNRNSKRSRGSRRSSGGSNMLSAIALMIIAILLLVFVFAYISNNSFLSFFKRFKSDGSETETTSDETKTQDAADEPGLVWLDKDELVYVLSEDELSDREDSDIIEEDGKKLLASEWLEDGSDLYYFDDKGRAVSDLNEGAFNYRFDREYRLYSISYNNAYISESENDQKDYPGVVQTKTLWAFLDTEKQVDDLYAIKYKKTTESFSHLLGGDSNLQYTSNFAMNVADGYIYYVAFVDASDKMLEPIANKLFRMKPGAEKREICAEDVKGYKLIGAGNGDIHVYVDDGTKVKRVTSFKEDESMKTFPEDGDYYVDTSSGKAMLMLEGGYPVTLASDSFKAGNFVYAVNANGEITSVASKSQVNYGGYTYTVENGDSFGKKKARVIRSANGKKEVISAEFDGSVSNMHFDFDSSKIVAEYTDANGSAGLVTISLDGDVDIVYDASDLGSKCILYAIKDGYATVRTSNTFKQAKLVSSYPLAVGVDPVEISEAPESEANESAGSSDPSNAATGNTAETHAQPAASDSSADTEIGAAAEPGAANGQSGSALGTVEKKGPGEA